MEKNFVSEPEVQILAAEILEGEQSAERDGWLTQEEVFERLKRRLRDSERRHTGRTS